MYIVTLLFVASIVGLLILHWWQTRSRFAKLINKFPMPSCKPFIGHVWDYSLDPVILFSQLRKLTQLHSETFCMWSVNYGTLHIITHDDAEIILTSMKHIEKGYLYDALKPWLGEGLLISNGTKWQHRRKILTPTFHFNILRKFVTIFGEQCHTMIETVKQERQKGHIDLVPLITRKTLSSICETAMGTKLNLKSKKHQSYVNAIQGLVKTIVQRALSPILYPDFTMYISLVGYKQRQFSKTLHSFTDQIIREREETFQISDAENLEKDDDYVGPPKKRLAMLDLLLLAKKTQNSIDDEGIREEVDTFMFEGHDTTTIGICTCLMLIAHHKNVQQKIITEMDEIFGSDKRNATYDDLQNMKYLDLCIKESLRLYPSVPLITRTLREEVQLTNHVAPANCEVFLHIYDIHRNPKIYPEPEKFDPDRFLPENCNDRPTYAYIPFSAGPRNCIGQKYAMLEMKSVISGIFRNFTLDPVTQFEELNWSIDLVLRVDSPMNVIFNLRE